jgi:MFS transporter, FSR family, fosmidomycin resistance protein
MTADPGATPVALATAVSAPAARAKPDMRLLGLLPLGHMVIDINQGSLSAMLPFLASSLALSYTATGVIVLMANTANTTSSLIQPLFGHLADKTARRWLLRLSVSLSALGLGFKSALWISALMPLGGFAAALFLPEPRAR